MTLASTLSLSFDFDRALFSVKFGYSYYSLAHKVDGNGVIFHFFDIPVMAAVAVRKKS